MMRWNGIVMLILALFLPTGQAVELSDADQVVLNRIQQRLAGVNTLRANFTQEKTLAVFEQVITLHGWMALTREGSFAWHVVDPIQYGLVVHEGMMRQWDEDTGVVQQTALSANPMLRVVFEQLSQWFSGDYHALMEQYSVQVLDPGPPVLAFTPLERAQEAHFMKQVVLHFSAVGDYLERIDMKEVSGDQTALLFSDTVVNEPLGATVWKVEP